ncbi:HTH-type transcriptional regulator BhcR [Paracoccus jeotgali]|uniref:IclR family transcriptional regulator n=1 Tax=Paracoccus jeotgali TaxID=2065379 RepID=A0A2K9MHA3_9RHOB|nr:HTH-type transcriptional regulator BhcR [Paracoccus jeotgali]AUM75003.1 IclR family transcriptional regulator [Paracoccus jeotgali]
MTDTDPTPSPERRPRGRPRGWGDSVAQNRIKSLDRAMAVFETLSEGPGRSLGALAAETGQSPATLYRILLTLEGRGLVEFDPAGQLWQIGARAFVIGSRFLRRTSLAERARPILRALMEETGETANLGIAHEGGVLFIAQVETHASIRAFFPPGTLSPPHASGIGKALLAWMAPDRRQRLLSQMGLERFTPRTLTDPAALEAELDLVRQRGYAVDDEERNIGMRCIAAPVPDSQAEMVAGLSVSGPTSRVTPDQIERLSRAVIAAATELSLAIGGEPKPAAEG